MSLERLIGILFALLILFEGINIFYTGITSDFFVMPGMIHEIKIPLRYILGSILILLSIYILFSKNK
jgi:hypothetical protein